MKRRILDELKRIEEVKGVKILMAVESGSRAWGFASSDSDYDVRFIYKRPVFEYLKLEKTRDVIELPIDRELDINGWDLSKTLRLMHNSNPTLFEWIGSPVRYMDTDFKEQLSGLMKKCFIPKSGIYHYLNTAIGNYKRHLDYDEVVLKKYFYVIRSLLACRWILERMTPPPMPFAELVDGYLDDEYRTVVDELMETKVNSPEVKRIPRIVSLDNYIKDSIDDIELAAAKLPVERKCDWEMLNEVFRAEIMNT